MDIISRLRRFLEYRGVSVTQFADACNMPRPSVSQMLNGRNRKISDETISKIHAAFPDLSMLWLMFGEGEMLTDNANQTLESGEPESEPNEGVFKDFEDPVAYPPAPSPASALRDYQWNDNSAPRGRQNEIVADTPSKLQRESPGTRRAQPIPPSRNVTAAGSASTAATMPRSIDFSGAQRKGKNVVTIIVYYDDNSFQPFVPDSSGRNPFMPK